MIQISQFNHLNLSANRLESPDSKTDQPDSADPNVWRGRLLVIAAALLWSTSAFFAKAPIFDDWPVESRGLLLACWRGLFASVSYTHLTLPTKA